MTQRRVVSDRVEWVQHVSHTGKKYKVLSIHCGIEGSPGRYRVIDDNGEECLFPADEYAPWEEPVVWKDVSAKCVIDEHGELYIKTRGGMQRVGRYLDPSSMLPGFRLRKVQVCHNKQHKPVWAFILEQRQG